MGSKNKLKRFKENETFTNVFQPTREEVVGTNPTSSTSTSKPYSNVRLFLWSLSVLIGCTFDMSDKVYNTILHDYHDANSTSIISF